MSVIKDIERELNERFKAAQPERAPDHAEENPVGLDHDKAIALARELNRHQASMFVLFHQYQKHHWLVEGPQFRDLHLYLEDSYNAVHKDLDAIAERLTVLGAIPSGSPSELVRQAYVIHEPEGYFPIRDMLANDLKVEKAICCALRETITRATEAQDFATETLLKQTLGRCEDRAHHLDHYLADDSLTK